MSTPSFDAVLGGLGNAAVSTLKASMSDAWDALTDDEKKSAETLLFSLAKARLYEIAGYDVSGYLPTLEAAFLQWKVVGKQVALDGIRQAATEAFGLGGAFVAGAVQQIVKNAGK